MSQDVLGHPGLFQLQLPHQRDAYRSCDHTDDDAKEKRCNEWLTHAPISLSMGIRAQFSRFHTQTVLLRPFLPDR